jgi:hypothetical protein
VIYQPQLNINWNLNHNLSIFHSPQQVFSKCILEKCWTLHTLSLHTTVNKITVEHFAYTKYITTCSLKTLMAMAWCKNKQQRQQIYIRIFSGSTPSMIWQSWYVQILIMIQSKTVCIIFFFFNSLTPPESQPWNLDLRVGEE